MANEQMEYKRGDRVLDKVHKTKGTVIDIVPAASDGHHDTFATVRLDDGREVHLVENKMDDAK